MRVIQDPARTSGSTRRVEGTVSDPILTKHADEIRRLGRRVVAEVIEIGGRLTECKRICGHGNWLPWLDREFGWTEMTATRFINVYEMGKSNKLLDLELPVSSLYMLAAPSTPAEARDEILERAQCGEPVSGTEVKRIIDIAKRGKSAHKPKTRNVEPVDPSQAAAILAAEKAAKPTGNAATKKAGEIMGQLLHAGEAVQRAFARHLPAEMLADRDDIGPDSALARTRARNEELEAEVVRLRRENLAQRSELDDTKSSGANTVTEVIEGLRAILADELTPGWLQVLTPSQQRAARDLVQRTHSNFNEWHELRQVVAKAMPAIAPPPANDRLDIPECLPGAAP